MPAIPAHSYQTIGLALVARHYLPRISAANSIPELIAADCDSPYQVIGPDLVAGHYLPS